MTKLDQIKDTISSLDLADRKALAEWLSDFQFAEWDRQLEEDVKAGKLDFLIAEVREDIKAGRTRPLP